MGFEVPPQMRPTNGEITIEIESPSSELVERLVRALDVESTLDIGEISFKVLITRIDSQAQDDYRGFVLRLSGYLTPKGG